MLAQWFARCDESRSVGRLFPSIRGTMKLLLQLLSILRAIHWAHWGAHWKVKGDPFYADHLLFQRLYEGMGEEIDGLAEKIVGIYGPQTVSDTDVMAESLRFLNQYGDGTEANMYTGLCARALAMEQHLQKAIKDAYDGLKESGEITLGLDDFLMSLASAHETALYLLGQKLRTASLRKTSAPGDPHWMVAKYAGRDKNGKTFKKGEKVFYYPQTKTILTGADAQQASRDFDAVRFDEGY